MSHYTIVGLLRIPAHVHSFAASRATPSVANLASSVLSGPGFRDIMRGRLYVGATRNLPKSEAAVTQPVIASSDVAKCDRA